MRLSNNRLRRALQTIATYLAYTEHEQIADARKTVIEQFNLEDTEKLDAKWMVEEAAIAEREQLVGEGLLRDSGKRRLNPETGVLEIVWELTEKGRAATGAAIEAQKGVDYE